MKKLMSGILLSLIFMVSLSLIRIKAIDSSNSWTSNHLYDEYWSISYTGQLSSTWQDLYIKLAGSDYSELLYGNVYSGITLYDNETLTDTFIKLTELKNIGIYLDVNQYDDFVIDGDVLERLGKPLLNYDSIKIEIVQNTVYDNGLGIPSQYLDYYSSISDVSYIIPTDFINGLYLFDFEGSIINETDESITIEYNFLDLAQNGMTEEILMNFLTYSYDENYVKGPNSWNVFDVRYSQYEMYYNQDPITSSVSVNMIYDSINEKFTLPEDFEFTFHFDIFRFYESTLEMALYEPINLKINSSMSSAQINFDRLMHNEMVFSESIAFDPEIQNKDDLGAPKFQYYSLTFPFTSTKRIFVTMPNFTTDESLLSAWQEIGMYQEPWDFASAYNTTLFSSQDYTIEITYLKLDTGETNPDPIDPSSYVINHGTDYSGLASIDQVKNISSIELLDSQTNSYKITYIDGLYTHNFTFSFPLEINSADINAGKLVLYHFDPYYSFMTFTLNEDKIYQFDLKTMMFNELNKLKTVGFVAKEDLDVAALYIFLPKTFDYLFSIEMNYEYRIKDFFTGYEDWNYVRKTYNAFNDDNDGWFSDFNYTEVNPPRWYLLGLLIPYFVGDVANIYNEQTIQKMEVHNLPQDVSDRYLEYFGDDSSELNNYYYYRINLGQFRTVTSVGFDITNVVILDLSFLKNGEIITIPDNLIDEDIEDYIESNLSLPDYITYVTNVIDSGSEAISSILKYGGVILTTGLIIFVIYKFATLTQKPKKRY